MKTKLTEEKRIEKIDETNELIDEYNNLSFELETLGDSISRIGIIKMIIASPEDRELFKSMKKQYDEKFKRYRELAHKIANSEKSLGIKKSKRLKKNKTL